MLFLGSGFRVQGSGGKGKGEWELANGQIRKLANEKKFDVRC